MTGDFANIFEKVTNEKVLEGDGRAVCGTCKYRVEKAWKIGKPIQELLKRKHPISPLTSSQGDKQTETRIERKKGHRLAFDNITLSLKTTKENGSQTTKSGCRCWPSSTKGTCVKVCYNYILYSY